MLLHNIQFCTCTLDFVSTLRTIEVGLRTQVCRKYLKLISLRSLRMHEQTLLHLRRLFSTHYMERITTNSLATLFLYSWAQTSRKDFEFNLPAFEKISWGSTKTLFDAFRELRARSRASPFPRQNHFLVPTHT